MSYLNAFAQELTDTSIKDQQQKIFELIQVGKYKEAFEVYDSTKIELYSDKLHGEFLVVCKELGKAKLALAICNQELTKNPSSYYWNLKKVQFLVYDNQIHAAEILLNKIQPQDQLYNEISMILYAEKNDWLAYKFSAEQLLFKFNRKQSYQDVLFAFNKLSAFEAAQEWIRTHKVQLQEKDAALLGLIEARLWLIWANKSALDETEKYLFSKKALNIIDSLFSAKTLQQSDSLFAAYDKLNALYNMGEYTSVVNLYDKLPPNKPAFIELMTATAALESRQINKAKNLFVKILAQRPIENDTWIQYTYVLSDLNKYEKAISLLDSLLKKEPNYVIRKGKQLETPNYDKIYLKIQKAKLLYYGGYLTKALHLMDTLMLQLPLDMGLYQIRGNVLDAIGHHQNADQSFATAFTTNKKDVGLVYNIAGNHFAQFRYKEIDSILSGLKSDFPYSSSTKRLLKEWKEFNMHSIEIVGGYSNTFGLIQNGQGYTWGLNYASKPINYNWKVLLSTQQNFAEIPEGEILLTKFRAGVQYKKNNLQLNAQALLNNFGQNEVGLSVDASYFFLNKHTLQATIQRLSEQQPLRGLFYGITANQFGVGYTFRPNDLIRTSIQFDHFDFTDQNKRNALSAVVEAKLYHHSAFQLTGIGQLYTSNNTTNNVTYFSPISDFSSELSIRMHHTIKRSYEFSYQHSLQLSTAYYQQNSFKGGLISGLSYKQELNISYTKSVWLRLSNGNRLFDGVREPYFYLDIGINAKF